MSNETQNAVTRQEEAKAPATENRAVNMLMRPAADIIESKDGVTVYLDVPGVSREALDIHVEQDVLTVKGNINLHTPEALKPTYMDMHSGQFERSFTLSRELDADRIEANLNQGELKLFIPRSEQHKPRKIEIKLA